MIEKAARALSLTKHGDELEWPLYVRHARAVLTAIRPEDQQDGYQAYHVRHFIDAALQETSNGG